MHNTYNNSPDLFPLSPPLRPTRSKTSSPHPPFVTSALLQLASAMDSNYLLQVDYHEHRTDHPDYRHPYPPTFTPPDDPQFWPYAYPTAQSSLSNYPRYVPPQCGTQPETAPPFVYDQSAQPADDFAAPTRLGIFDISAMHAPIGSAEPWGPRDEGQLFLVRVAFPFIFSLLLPHNPRLLAIPR